MTSTDDNSTSGPVATFAGLPINVHDHVCVLYRGETQRDELMVDFLTEGVHARHKCYCMIAPTEHARIAAAVGSQARAQDTAGNLEFVGPGGSHTATGGFTADRMLTFWEEWGTTTYVRQGRTFARIGADMSWAKALVAPEFITDLARYESRFNLWASRYPQVTACMYDLDKFGGEVIVPIVKVHPKVWVDGLVVTNPYYLDSEYLLAGEVEDLVREGASSG
jgi:hypothetical protein